MQKYLELDFLLGATSPGGFYGYFDTLQANHKQGRLLLIKAGPGCGKSTLMRKIAAHFTGLGKQVELIHCSSDPTSLDGVLCPAENFAILDSTAPHTLEPKYPGVFEEIISLYGCVNNETLQKKRSELLSLFNQNAACHARAGRYIGAACTLLADTQRMATPYTNTAKAEAFAARLCARHLPKQTSTGKEETRMLSAMTLQGQLTYKETVERMASEITILQDDYGVAANILLHALRTVALERGYTVYTCYCPSAPGEKIDHLIIPKANFAVVTSNSFHPMAFNGRRVVHCTRFYNKAALEARRTRLRFNRKTATELIAEAALIQRQAKSLHDQIENYFIAANNFDMINEITASILAGLPC